MNATVKDTFLCGTDHLPAEADIVGDTRGCFSSVSAFDATDKGDVNAETQRFVLDRIRGILSCFPKSA